MPRPPKGAGLELCRNNSYNILCPVTGTIDTSIIIFVIDKLNETIKYARLHPVGMPLTLFWLPIPFLRLNPLSDVQ